MFLQLSIKEIKKFLSIPSQVTDMSILSHLILRLIYCCNFLDHHHVVHCSHRDTVALIRAVLRWWMTNFNLFCHIIWLWLYKVDSCLLRYWVLQRTFLVSIRLGFVGFIFRELLRELAVGSISFFCDECLLRKRTCSESFCSILQWLVVLISDCEVIFWQGCS